MSKVDRSVKHNADRWNSAGWFILTLESSWKKNFHWHSFSLSSFSLFGSNASSEKISNSYSINSSNCSSSSFSVNSWSNSDAASLKKVENKTVGSVICDQDSKHKWSPN